VLSKRELVRHIKQGLKQGLSKLEQGLFLLIFQLLNIRFFEPTFQQARIQFQCHSGLKEYTLSSIQLNNSQLPTLFWGPK